MITREWLAQATPDARAVYLDAMLGAFANVMGEIAKCAALCEDLGDHAVDGVDSMTHTLVAKGLSPATASELVRVGHALVDLPETEAALAENTVTFDQVRQLSKFLTPETDKTVEDFCARSVRSLEREAARHRPPPEPATAEDRWKRRSLHHFIDPVTGMFKLSFKGTPEDGAVIASTLAAVAEAFGKDPDTGMRDPLHQRLADSLVEVCGTHDPDENPAGSDRGCVSVHISAELLLEHYDADTGLCDLNLPVSTRLAKDTVRRVMCDGMAEAIYHDHDGNIVGIDEARRVIPPRLFRQLALRDDNTCRWPGCGRRSSVATRVSEVAQTGMLARQGRLCRPGTSLAPMPSRVRNRERVHTLSRGKTRRHPHPQPTPTPTPRTQTPPLLKRTVAAKGPSGLSISSL